MREEPALASLPFLVSRESTSLLVSLEVDLAGFIPAAPVLEAALAAVIMAEDGALTYWALAHPGPQADFHRREGFLIKLPDNL